MGASGGSLVVPGALNCPNAQRAPARFCEYPPRCQCMNRDQEFSMATPRMNGRWSVGSLEDHASRHAGDTQAASKEKSKGGAPAWFPSGPTSHNSAARRASGSQSGAATPRASSSSKPLRAPPSIRKRTTADSVIEAFTPRPPEAAKPPPGEPGGSAISATGSRSRQQQDRSASSTPAPPSTATTDAAMADFWLVLQQTQQDLADMLVSGATATEWRPRGAWRSALDAAMHGIEPRGQGHLAAAATGRRHACRCRLITSRTASCKGSQVGHVLIELRNLDAGEPRHGAA